MRQYKATVAVFLFMLVCCLPANATPVIDFANQEVFVKLEHGTTYNFTVTANESIDSWEWYLNDVARGINSSSINIAFSGRGQQNLTVVGTNINGNAIYTFYPYIHREITDDETETITETGYDELMDAVHDNDMNAGIAATTIPGVSTMGGFYYLFVLGMPFYMIWNRQQKLLLPSVIGLILGWLILPFMPEQYVKFLQLSVILGASAVLWSLYKDR